MSQVQRGFYHSGRSQSHRSPPRFMPIKLQVVKEDADAGEPADYLFEQDRITIGRGSGNDLTLPDQKVSKQHAEIRNDEGTYLLVDRDSKNNTYLDGQRVGEAEPYPLKSGDIFQVGDFKIEFAPLFMPSSETTAFAEHEEDQNPFAADTRRLVSALEGLAETYQLAPSDQRDEAFAEAVHDHVDSDIADTEAVQEVLRRLGIPTETASTSDGERTSTSAKDEALERVFDTVLQAVVRMISIPNHFWREFTGETLEHPQEKKFLYEADFDELRESLLGEHVSAEERQERLEHLSDAVDSLVAHNMAMLAGYKKAVMAGSKELLQRLNPIDAVEEAENGGMVDSFFGGGQASELERLERKWKSLYHGEWGYLESDLFRPTYIEAYVDRMAQAWDLDRAEILPPDEDG